MNTPRGACQALPYGQEALGSLQVLHEGELGCKMASGSLVLWSLDVGRWWDYTALGAVPGCDFLATGKWEICVEEALS